MDNCKHPIKVSIVLPCYNGARKISHAIESCQRQTMSQWELIIVDDGSSDDTSDIANNFIQNDNRISLIRHNTNKQLPASLNDGFEKATGEYLTWISDDNVMLPRMLEILCFFLDLNSNYDMVVGSYLNTDVNGNIISSNIPPNDINDRIYADNHIGCCFMYRKNIANKIGTYDTDLFLVEDYDYWIRIALTGKIGVIQEKLYIRTVHPKMLSVIKEKEKKEKLLLLRIKHLNSIKQKLSDNPKLLSQFYFHIVDSLHGKEKRTQFWNFAKHMPFHFGLAYLTRHQIHLLLNK